MRISDDDIARQKQLIGFEEPGKMAVVQDFEP